ncbi:Type 1 glutamine amidotransferase [Glutamicibacter creatinolyticus]|uniref:Type 1 glutamine amidotransferase n=2 Tax=Glutamicibacter creatinolyticus TaxID=162496 RepID=A0A5B7WWV1_9MICC|nr:Type 1 glutamine amidotransferase [Glutamicibacter creatinolyticus]
MEQNVDSCYYHGMSYTPSQDILFHHFEEFRKLHYPSGQKGVAFARFMTSIALREYPLSESDLEAGFTDGPHDGGIDGFHVVLNRTEAITPETKGLSTKSPPPKVPERTPFDVVIIQSKMDTGGWDGLALARIREGLEVIFDSSKTEKDLLDHPLRPKLAKQVMAFRKFQRKLISLDPVRSVKIYVMQPVNPMAISQREKRSAKALERSIAASFPSGTKVDVHLCDVNEIERMRNEQVEFKGSLKFALSPNGLAHGRSQAWLGLVTIGDFLKFLSRDKGVLRDEFFVSNIRDFAGTTATVNAAIKNSLEKDSATSFWWMNNGVTILADEARPQTDNTWTLVNPQIVNGLQTSNVIYETHKADSMTKKRKKESLVVRVIAEQDPQIRESIIGGTNNQAQVGAIQLYANDKFQIELEEFLLSKGWFYERRRWQYRNTKASRSKIRSIVQVAQAAIALLLLRPDTARTRPRDYLKSKNGYAEVFSERYPMQVYATVLGRVSLFG